MFTLFTGVVTGLACPECRCTSKLTSSSPVCPNKTAGTYYRVSMFGYACDIDNPCADWYPFSITKCVGQSANPFDNSVCETETPDDPAVDYWTPPPMPTPIPPMTPVPPQTPLPPQTLPPMPTPLLPQTPLPPQTLPPMPTPVQPQTPLLPQTLPPMPTPLPRLTPQHKHRLRAIFALSNLLTQVKLE